MKIIATLVLAVLSLNANAQTETMKIGGFKSIEPSFENNLRHNVKIENISNMDVLVSVMNIENKTQVKGFGLNGKSNATVSVEKGTKLVLTNKNPKAAEVRLSFIEKEITKPNGANYIQFTLRNSSAKAIPLIIPTVMNPNLSPFSNSGVSLKIGQEIYFKNKGKKEILLIVNDNIKSGDKLDVAELVKQRQKELLAKKN